MNTLSAVKTRLIILCEEKGMTINRLATESGIPPSTVKGILYGRSQNPGVVTLKKLCDGLGVTLTEFFDTEEFRNLEQEIK